MLHGPEEASRWRAQPLGAVLLRMTVVTMPAVAAMVTAALAAPLLPGATSMPGRVAWWLVLGAIAAVPLLVTARVLRRWLPLASLLRMSMLFPGRAPSRLGMARMAAGIRNLQACTEEARRRGLEDDSARAAEGILALVTALNHHDARTRGHSERVHLVTDLLAAELGIDPAGRDRLRWAALAHDIGKVEIDAGLLNKPSPPTAVELEALQRHPIEGARFCIPLRPWLGDWALAIEQHHERWDGRGYPYGLASDEIALGARVVAVADAYETMITGRPYRRALSPKAARLELARGAGTQFDPDVVAAFLRIPRGRMRWAAGAFSGLAQWPVVQHAPRLREVTAVVAVAVAGAATLAAGGLIEPGAPSFAGWRDEPGRAATVDVPAPGAPAGAGAPDDH